MTSFVAVLPAIAPDLAHACIESMCADLRHRLVVVDNTEQGRIAHVHRDVFRAVAPHRNIGVTRAWNVGLGLADKLAADWLVIVSQSVRFGPAGGQDLLDALDEEPYVAHSQFGWHYLAISRAMSDRVGQFDPVFFAYGGDTDWLYRAGLAGLPSPRENDGRYTQVVCDATCEPDGETLRRRLVKMNYSEHLDAYRRKWGGDQGDEKFVTPYDDPKLDLTHVGPYDPKGLPG